ncbi:hypothetical protein AB9K41_26890 [Cribrihabitans sp. XS_ASV171]
MTQQTLAPWQANLTRGDVVAFRFPHEFDGPEKEKTRPSLVLAVTEISGELLVDLAYGTCQPRSNRRGCVVSVTERDELIAASLVAPTNFDVERRLTVSVRNPGFDVHPTSGTAVLGKLSGDALTQLQRVTDRLKGKADHRPRPRFRRRQSPRLVQVEYRRRGRTVSRETRHV